MLIQMEKIRSKYFIKINDYSYSRMRFVCALRQSKMNSLVRLEHFQIFLKIHRSFNL